MRWRLCRLLRYRTASLIPVLHGFGLTVTAFRPFAFWYGGVHCRDVGSKPAASGIESAAVYRVRCVIAAVGLCADFAEDSGCGEKATTSLASNWVWMPSCCLKSTHGHLFPLAMMLGALTLNYQRFW